MDGPFSIVIRRTGGPEVLEFDRLARLEPGRGELLIRHEAIGLNYIDTYHRSGLYPLSLPSALGSEAAGVVEAVGEEVEGFREGEAVGYFLGPPGAYATHRILAADRVVKLPDAIDTETAAAVLLKGCTAEFLIERCARVQTGDQVLVHAAAGGVGSLLVPWLKYRGAVVIAHAGNSIKAEQAKELGADFALSCPMDELALQVRSLTDGLGVHCVFDGVGKASWQASLGCVRRRGLLVTFGNASGPAPPFSAQDLLRAGSIFVTRPTLFDYTHTAEELRACASRLFEMVASGTVRPIIGARYPLAKTAEAHRALEERKTVGSTLLIP